MVILRCGYDVLDKETRVFSVIVELEKSGVFHLDKIQYFQEWHQV